MGSERFKLNLDDLKKVAKNAVLVGAAAGLTYVSANLTNVDLGAAGALVVPIATMALQGVISWLKDNSKTEVK